MAATNWFLTVIVSGIFLFEYLFTEAKSEVRIIGGEIATHDDTKHQVSIRLRSEETTFGEGHICGGSLIGPNKVLTAAQCVYNFDDEEYRKPGEFIVVMGTLNRLEHHKATFVSAVSSIATTGSFDPESMQDDIALMFLTNGLHINQTYPTIEPIALNDLTLFRGALCQVSGWGKYSNDTDDLSADLRIANVTLISKAECSNVLGNKIKNGMMCAGNTIGGVDACQKDSGGPLMCNGVLAGVISWGNGCSQPGYTHVYTAVKNYIDWITNTNAAWMGKPGPSILLLIAAAIFLSVHLLLVNLTIIHWR